MDLSDMRSRSSPQWVPLSVPSRWTLCHGDISPLLSVCLSQLLWEVDLLAGHPGGGKMSILALVAAVGWWLAAATFPYISVIIFV